MADSNIPTPPTGGENKGRNLLKKKDYDVLDPEAESRKSLGDMKDDAKKTAKNVKNFSKVISKIPIPALIVILIIIMIIGIIGFVTTIPGMLMGKIKQIAQDCIDAVQSWFTTDADAKINPDDVLNLANYLEEMDYDLTGYGFIVPKLDAAQKLGYATPEELIADGYNVYYKTEDDVKAGNGARYYNEAGQAYDGYYYNSLGILIDNATGKVTADSGSSDSYTDKYGIERSTTETNSKGKGKIVGFGDNWTNEALDISVDTTLLRSYLLSDYRIYAIRNRDQTTLNKVFAGIKKTFGGYKSGWSKGLLKIYYAKNGIANGAWDSGWNGIIWGDQFSINGTELSLKNGYYNNKMKFDISGWSDRYGMNLEFLLSLHIATMEPDLVYAMLQNFDTEVQVYLNDSGDSEVESSYVDMMDTSKTVNDSDARITIDDVKDKLSEQGGFDINDWLINKGYLTSDLSSLAISKADAQYLLLNLPLESPLNCTGQAEVDEIIKTTYKDSHWYTYDDLLNRYGITNLDMGKEAENLKLSDRDVQTEDGGYDFKAQNCTINLGNDENAMVTSDDGSSERLGDIINDDDYRFFKNLGTQYGYNESSASPDKETESKKEVNATLNTSVFDVDGIRTTRSWSANAKDASGNDIKDSDGDTEEVDYTWITYKFVVYKVGEDRNPVVDGYTKTDKTLAGVIVWEYLIRGKTYDELVASGAIDANGNAVPRDEVCSARKDLDKCCSNCQKYVKKVVVALAKVADEDYKFYTPYIARVLGSWFRDTYFVIPENSDTAIDDYMNETSRSAAEKYQIENSYGTNRTDSNGNTVDNTYVIVDEDYLADTGEYWTSYEMTSDGSYQLYYLNPDGTTSDTKMEDWLSQNGYNTQHEAEEAGYAFVKKAKTKNVSDIQKSNDLTDVLWTAYDYDSGGNSTGWIKVEKDDGNDRVNSLYDYVTTDAPNYDGGGIYYNVKSTTSINQIEDAQRSETNATVKYLFKYRKFYNYDGSTEKAEAISRDRSGVLKWAKEYLQNTYGSNWANHIAGYLAKYGRGALRQTYSTGLNFGDDPDDIAEEWLSWQLDMYYTGITNDCPDDYIILKDGFETTITYDFDGDGEEETVTRKCTDVSRDGFSYDYDGDGEDEKVYTKNDIRNPDLVATTNITKNSLNAFTILENSKTLSAEYAYRDFKELIVELNYFDKEDLSDKISEVFTWVLPNISAAGWPIRPYDKQNEGYGALIESHATYVNLGVDYSGGDGSSSGSGSGSSSGIGSSTDESKIAFIGDSWIAGLQSSGEASSTYFDGRTGKAANDFLSSAPNIPSDASAIVVNLGVNNPDDTSSMERLIDSLDSSGKPVYVVQVAHVGLNYSGAYSPSEMNQHIDSYNSTIRQYCGTKTNVKFINPTSGITNSSGYLDHTSDGLHLDSEGYKIWYNAIVGGSNSSSSSGNNSSSTSNSNSSGSTGAKASSTKANSSNVFSVEKAPADDPSKADRIVTANGVQYKQFDQGGTYGATSTSNGEYQITSDSGNTLSSMGCGVYSATSLFSGYTDEDVTPEKTVKYIHEHYGTSAFDGGGRAESINKFLNDNGVTGQWYSDNYATRIKDAFNEGKPVIILIASPGGSIWTTANGHFFCAVGADSSNVYTVDSSGAGPGSDARVKHAGGVDTLINDVSSTICNLWVPDEAPNGNISSASSFQGYGDGEYVASPVTGKVLEYGTHMRKNVYTEEDELVEYIIIEALGSDSTFNDNNISNHSDDTELDDNEIAEGLNLFYDEYEDNCENYQIMIDGIDVDLNLTDDEENRGVYEENEVAGLYDSDEKKKRDEDEEKKAGAPFVVVIGNGESIDSFPEISDGETNVTCAYSSINDPSTEIYIKEGKYIGTTISDYDDEAIKELQEQKAQQAQAQANGSGTNNSNTNTSNTNNSGTNTSNNTNNSNTNSSNAAASTTSSNEFTGPAEYIRILLKDTDFSVVDNVEDFFNIPDPEEEGSTFGTVNQEYQAQSGDLEVLAEGMWNEALSTILGDSSLSQEEMDFESYCQGYSIVNKLLEQNKQYYGAYYDEGDSMSPLVQVLTNHKYTWYGSPVPQKCLAVYNGGPGSYNAETLAYAEFCLKYDSSSVPIPASSNRNLCGDAKSMGYSEYQGKVIPRSMCQQGGLGDGASGQNGIILVGYWDRNKDGLFGIGDELWGIDRAMEGFPTGE